MTVGLNVDTHDGIPVVRMPEDVDAANAQRLRDELIAYVGNDPLVLVLDLGGTRYLDSAGIDMIFRLNQRLAERRATLRIVIGPGSHLLRLSQIVGLGRAMPVHETLAAALSGGVEAQAASGEAAVPAQQEPKRP